MKPHIYTMPEEFVKDSNVPARWRALAVLNGFFLNGKKCWASNEWIGKEIKAHKDSVSQAIKELEDLKLIRCERTRRTRLISQVLHPMIGDNTYQEGGPTPILDRPQRLSNSVSNAVSINTAQSAEPIREEKDEPTRSKAVLGAKQIYEPLVLWAEEERGAPFLATHRLKQYKALKIARENKIKSADLKERWQEMASDKFWASNGFDWLNVVNSFNKKPV